MAEQALEYHLRHALLAWQELQKKNARRPPRQQRGRNMTTEEAAPGFLNVLSKQHSHDRMSLERCCQEKVKRYLGDEFEYIVGMLSPRDKKSLFRHLCGIYKGGGGTLDELACIEQHQTFQPRIGNDTIVPDKEKRKFKAFIEYLVYSPEMLQKIQRPDGEVDKNKMQAAYDRFQMSTPRKNA